MVRGSIFLTQFFSENKFTLKIIKNINCYELRKEENKNCALSSYFPKSAARIPIIFMIPPRTCSSRANQTSQQYYYCLCQPLQTPVLTTAQEYWKFSLVLASHLTRLKRVPQLENNVLVQRISYKYHRFGVTASYTLYTIRRYTLYTLKRLGTKTPARHPVPDLPFQPP